MEKEIAEIAKALGAIAKNLTSLAKKAVKSATPGRRPAKAKAVAPPSKRPKAERKVTVTVPDQVLKQIRKSGEKGMSIDAIQKKTGLTTQQINNALYKLTKSGAVSRTGRGVYAAADLAGQKPLPKSKPKAKAKTAAKAPKAPRKPRRIKTSEPVPQPPPAETTAQVSETTA